MSSELVSKEDAEENDGDSATLSGSVQERKFEEEDAFCRFCFESRGGEGEAGKENDSREMVKPCGCKGSGSWVHRDCLEKWQMAIILQGQREDKRHVICNACRQPYTVKPPSRIQVLRQRIGISLADRVSIGAWLISSATMCRQPDPELTSRLPLAIRTMLEVKRAHWRHGIYLIFSLSSSSSGQRGSQTLEEDCFVFALNTNRVMNGDVDKPIADCILHLQAQNPDIDFVHHNGGPVEWAKVFSCVIGIPESLADFDASHGDQTFPFDAITLPSGSSDWKLVVCGLQDGVRLFRELQSRGQQAWNNRICTFSGFARWSLSQLLNEIARGSWGVLADARQQSSFFLLSDASSNPQTHWESFLEMSTPPTLSSSRQGQNSLPNVL